MKFTYGQWLLKDDHTLITAAEAYEVKAEKNSLTVYAPATFIHNRGNTLNLPVITIKFSSNIKNIIHTQVCHFDGEYDNAPKFELADEQPEVVILDNDEFCSLTSGDTTVKVYKGNEFIIEYLYKGRLLTKSSRRSLAYIINDKKQPFFREQLSLKVGECVYGLGERFTPFIKNGQIVDIWNEDGGTSSEISYKNIPFYITNENYGVFVNHTEEVSFEVASEQVERVQFSVAGEKLDYFVIGGENMKDVTANYVRLTGMPSLPPAWSFGLWLTTSFTTSYDEKTVTSFIDGMAERDIPLKVFHFDCFWMKGFEWCNFEWDAEAFPEPKAMLGRLKEKGLKICVWINPYIAQKSALFDEAKQLGYLLKRPNGNVYQTDLWQAGMGIVDFTNPNACQWFKDKLGALMDDGVDSFKTDFGERIPTDVVYYDGSDPIKMHNYYTYLYNKVVYELLCERLGQKEAVVFARSATVGSQKFPVHWGGDCWATFESMAESLRGGLSLCMSGFGFWSHDMGGFESTATPNVYKRWLAFGFLSTHSRLHGSTSYRVPWLFDEEAVDVCRYFSKLKCSLMPYIYSQAKYTSVSGIPMMRSMIMEFSSDTACKYLDNQYMLGDNLLVAPIFSDDGNVTYYLPEGVWTNLLDNTQVTGGKYITQNHGFISIPLLARPNSIIAIGNNDSMPDYDFANNVSLHLFNLEDNNSAECDVINLDGECELTVSIKREANTYSIRSRGKGKKHNIILRNIFNISSVSGGTFEKTDFGVKILPANNEIIVEL